MKAFSIFAVLSALLSIVSWTYRFIDEYSRYQEIAFYIRVPVVSWGGLIGTASMLHYKQIWIKVPAVILLVPLTLLWALSVWAGFFGLKIH